MAPAGDLNDWEPHGTQMQPMGDGWWTCRVQLTPGVCQFRYRVDGEWLPDYAAFGLISGAYGWNSLACVNPTPQRDEELRHDERFAQTAMDNASRSS